MVYDIAGENAVTLLATAARQASENSLLIMMIVYTPLNGLSKVAMDIFLLLLLFCPFNLKYDERPAAEEAAPAVLSVRGVNDNLAIQIQ